MADFAAIGHVIIDSITDLNGQRETVAGPVLATALTAKVLGKTVRLVTKVGDDIANAYLSQMTELGICLDGMIIKDTKTTRVWVDLTEKERQGGVIYICDEIRPKDVADLPSSVLINPGLWEVPWETLTSISAETIAVDVQGFVRDQHRSVDTITLLPRWSEAGILKRHKILKATEEELRDFTDEKNTLRGLEKVLAGGPQVAIATQGNSGALLLTADGAFHVPTFPIEKKDDMGAGDCFLSAFFCEYLDGKDPLWCAAMGAAATSCLLETVGLDLSATVTEIVRRAENIAGRIERL